MATAYKDSSVIDITAGSDLVSGDVVFVGTIAGIVVSDTATGKIAALQTEGQYKFVASEAITAGDVVSYDSVADKVGTTSTDDPVIGIAVTDAADDGDEIVVLINA